MEEPFAVLRDLHARYDGAGPALTRARLEQLDGEVREWQSGIVELEARATQLADRDGDAEDAARLRAEAASARGHPPRGFEQAMNRSQAFFHPDKRKKDLATSAEDKSQQFARIKEAWDQLRSYRLRLRALRAYRVKRAAL
ncbi:MAG: hypothetical protein P4M11_14230 [Candidatus Pacebacteria bacterium]|nr:hypothetical protein [Candidatus Paceibacterota bacterium]